jgi:hypothetical protein
MVEIGASGIGISVHLKSKSETFNAEERRKRRDWRKLEENFR